MLDYIICVPMFLPSPHVRALGHIIEVSSEGGVVVLTLELVGMGSIWCPGDITVQCVS